MNVAHKGVVKANVVITVMIHVTMAVTLIVTIRVMTSVNLKMVTTTKRIQQIRQQLQLSHKKKECKSLKKRKLLNVVNAETAVKKSGSMRRIQIVQMLMLKIKNRLIIQLKMPQQTAKLLKQIKLKISKLLKQRQTLEARALNKQLIRQKKSNVQEVDVLLDICEHTANVVDKTLMQAMLKVK